MDLIVDTDFLVDLGHDLRTVAGEFEQANARSDDAADSVGHGELADRVREFAHNWDDRRTKMLGNVGKLAESATGVGGAFNQLEDDLVAALKGEK